MALFLTESIDTEEKVTVSLSEAYEGLLEASMDMNELSEALLQGDFIIHENAQNLSEAEQVAREGNFFKKAAAKVKELIIKIRDHVVVFLKKIGEHARTLWNKITGKENPSGKVRVPKGMVAAANAAGSALQDFQKKALAAPGKLFGKEIKEEESKVKKAFNYLKGLTGKGSSGETEEVAASSMGNVFKIAAAATTVAATAYGVLSVASKKVDSIANMANVTDEDKKAVVGAKSQASAAQKLASLFGSFTTVIGKAGAAAKAGATAIKGAIDAKRGK